MFSVDFKDTYFQKMSIHLDSQPYLCIALKGKVCQLKAVISGLSTVPQVFI